jgi:uncharacterized membrane protein
MEFENRLDIGRPRRAVFEYLADLEHLPEWNYAIEKTTKISEGPVGVGAEYEQTRTIPRRQTERLKIMEYKPDELLVVEGDLGPFHGIIRYELAALEEQATQVVNKVTLRVPQLMGLLAGPLSKNVQQAVAKNLTELRRILESEAQ